MTRPITIAELQELQRGKEEYALFNVLPDAQYSATESIAGSRHAPFGDPAFVESVERQTAGDKHQRVVVYCAGPDCEASARAAERLVEAGFTHVEVYRGGLEEWKASQSGGRGVKEAQDGTEGARHQAGRYPSGRTGPQSL
ncbi:MAG TPA: rhodanese-like domain-containing protein [Planctomycetota bacterium]|nr:rhodanese-like domain-containing protein [Planctomycetota bacterium]